MMKQLLGVSIVFFLLLMNTPTNQADSINFDPLVDIEVTVEIKAIRYLEDATTQLTTLHPSQRQNRMQQAIGLLRWLREKNTIEEEKPTMYVKVFINDVEFVSPIYNNTYYVYEPDFSATLNVPNDVEFVDITIQLWDSTEHGDIPLDISPIAGEHEAHMIYSIATGHWTGDDYLGDPSGYGRLNGCDDGSIYESQRDCELWFDIYQNTYDGDGIPYWIEVNVYGTDPTIDNRGQDLSDDGVPIDWEHRWGYCPHTWYDHKNLDLSGDGITNYEKYLTWKQYASDPYRKEVFVQVDVMEEGPDGQKTYFPEGAFELLYTAFNRQNVVLHLDIRDANASNALPFYDEPSTSDIRGLYDTYFIQDEDERWREGVFHYGMILYNVRQGTPPGFAFRRNAFIVASQGMEEKSKNPFVGSKEVVYASAFMHELGHTFNFWPIPGHNRRSIYLRQPLYWYNMAYRSCMNYGWMYQFVDYSDGSGRLPDRNDWERIDYSYFK